MLTTECVMPVYYVKNAININHPQIPTQTTKPSFMRNCIKAQLLGWLLITWQKMINYSSREIFGLIVWIKVWISITSAITLGVNTLVYIEIIELFILHANVQNKSSLKKTFFDLDRRDCLLNCKKQFLPEDSLV